MMFNKYFNDHGFAYFLLDTIARDRDYDTLSDLRCVNKTFYQEFTKNKQIFLDYQRSIVFETKTPKTLILCDDYLFGQDNTKIIEKYYKNGFDVFPIIDCPYISIRISNDKEFICDGSFNLWYNMEAFSNFLEEIDTKFIIRNQHDCY